MPEFHKVSFDADELDAIRRACNAQSGQEDRMLDEAAGGSLEGVVVQESRADDMLLLKSTVAIFKPGQTILITREDLAAIKNCLKNDAPSEPGARAIKKIDASLSNAAERR
jgi:hypothetical protein